MSTFQIRISRLIGGKPVRTYLDIEAENEAEALLKAVAMMKEATRRDV